MAIQLADRQEELAEFSPEQMAQVDEVVAKNQGKPGALIPVLEDVQSVLGYLPQAIQRKVAQGLNIPVADVYGVVTFYSFFSMVPKGRHNIRVCFGTACYVKGAQRIFEKLSSSLGIGHGGCTEDRRFSLETVRCLGVCGLAPVMLVDEDVHGQLKISEAEKKLTSYE